MVFHPNFCQRRLDCCDTPDWFEQRSKLYEEVAKWDNGNIKEVYFDFSSPDCGWIDVSIYFDGKKIHTFPISEAFDPFCEIKEWMEDVVNDFKLGSDLYIFVEGRTIILHYEHIRLAQVGCGRKFVNEDRDKDEWESYDANSHYDIGLFYVYDSVEDEIPVACLCKTKDFLFSLYNGLLYYSSKSKHSILIGKEWYYSDHDDDGTPLLSNWDLYNTLKSPLLEWNYDSKEAYRHQRPRFNAVPPIKETVHMWAEWCDALFWHQRGGCCGNADGFSIDTEDLWIDLSDMKELRIWYDEFDNRDPSVDWEDDTYWSWFHRGWGLAKEVRKRLPASVDLFYQWKYFKKEDDEFKSVEIPIIVPDERNLVTKK